jgi:hypothetical protein
LSGLSLGWVVMLVHGKAQQRVSEQRNAGQSNAEWMIQRAHIPLKL